MKFLKAATAVAILAAMSVPPASSAAPVCGDVNQTSSVTSADALLVLRKSVSQPVTLSCSAYDQQYSQCQQALDSCQGGGVCGDGSVEFGEECEDGKLGGESCASLGYAGGVLSCGVGCSFDVRRCYESRYVETPDTIVDRETGLEWEKKSGADGMPNAADVHDADNAYNWCVPGGLYPSCANTNNPFDGTAATTFLAKLNGNAEDVCFAGHCDWRLPTIDELETIFEPEDCETAPCPADEIFLPMSTSAHWSSTSETPYNVFYAWGVIPNTAERGAYYKRQEMAVRAVRSAD